LKGENSFFLGLKKSDLGDVWGVILEALAKDWGKRRPKSRKSAIKIKPCALWFQL